MATYAIGDIHGNLDALQRLLDALAFDAGRDRLWFVGDIVNRGPDSLGCLRLIRALGDAAIVTLGNHDLALLVKTHRFRADNDINKSAARILHADDGPALLDWLRRCPLLHSDRKLNWTMVHAGIPREWSIGEAHAHARELEAALRGPDHRELLAHLYGDTPERWSDSLAGIKRLRFITNALTRQRFVYPDGTLDMVHKTTIEATPAPLVPWFALAGRASVQERIVFGHWSALSPSAWPQHNAWCIDDGAAWGGELTALRLDSGAPQSTSVPG